MSEKCHIKNCINSATHYRDCTITGIGDFRYYCDEHIEVADKKWAEFEYKMKVAYLQSCVVAAEKKVVEAQKRLSDILAKEQP